MSIETRMQPSSDGRTITFFGSFEPSPIAALSMLGMKDCHIEAMTGIHRASISRYRGKHDHIPATNHLLLRIILSAALEYTTRNNWTIAIDHDARKLVEVALEIDAHLKRVMAIVPEKLQEQIKTKAARKWGEHFKSFDEKYADDPLFLQYKSFIKLMQNHAATYFGIAPTWGEWPEENYACPPDRELDLPDGDGGEL